MISKKNIFIVSICIVIAVLIASYYFVYNKPAIEGNNQQVEEQKDPEEEEITIKESDKPLIDTTTKEGLLTALDMSGKEEDFESFAKYLKIVYQNQWDKDQDLEKKESDTYMLATTKYFDAGNIDEALRISSIVFNEVPQGWRFRYLRIRCLEKMGRDAYNSNDLINAEKYAMDILQMMYRPEGANLLADVYIKKIEDNLLKGDKASAEYNIWYIWDYEVDQDRRDKLTELKQTIGAN